MDFFIQPCALLPVFALEFILFLVLSFLLYLLLVLLSSFSSSPAGNAANYAETEQFLLVPGDKSAAPARTRVVSFLQTRGSIPLLWAQVRVEDVWGVIVEGVGMIVGVSGCAKVEDFSNSWCGRRCVSE